MLFSLSTGLPPTRNVEWPHHVGRFFACALAPVADNPSYCVFVKRQDRQTPNMKKQRLS